jgi:hypothetical protein
MAPDTTGDGNALERARIYLDVVRLEDGRYRVQFVKPGAVPRTSYSAQVGAVVKQAQRAGNIPVHTDDTALRRLCDDQRVELID